MVRGMARMVAGARLVTLQPLSERPEGGHLLLELESM